MMFRTLVLKGKWNSFELTNSAISVRIIIAIHFYRNKESKSESFQLKVWILNLISNKRGCASGKVKVSLLNINWKVQVNATTELGHEGKLEG